MRTMNKKYNFLAVWVLLVWLSPVRAQFFVHADASQLSCTCYQLTPAINSQVGAVWNTTLIDLNNPFDFTFTVFLGCDQNIWTGADGIAFGLQQNGTNVGVLGGGQGLGGVTPSLGVFIDTYANPVHSDPANDHISINSNGDVDHATANNLDGPYDLGEVEDCEDDTLRIVWDPSVTTYTVYYNGALVLTHVGDIINTIFGGDPMVYWGFTGATGGADNEQRFCLDLTADFSSNVSTTNGCLYDTIQFLDESTSTLGAMASWNWDFGDGTTSAVPNPQHAYDSSASYLAMLTVTDASGCEEVHAVPVLISSHQIEVSVSDDTLCLGSQANLNVSLTPGVASAGIIYNYTWLDASILSDATIANPITNVTATNQFIISVNDNLGCDAIDSVEVYVHNAQGAGSDGTATACSADPSFDLFTELTGTPGIGGVWVDANQTIISNIFNPATDSSSTLTYILTNGGICPDSIADVTVTVIANPDAGINGVLEICQDAQAADMFSFLGGTPDSNGVWTDGAGLVIDSLFDPQTEAAGTYYYTSSNGQCPDSVSQIITLIYNVPSPGLDGATTVCSADPSFDLLTELNGTPGSGGIWVDISQTIISNIFNPATDSSSTLTYILTNGGICPDSTADVTVTVITNPDAGINGVLEICQDAQAADMFSFLGGTPDSNGVWTDGSGIVVDSLFNPQTEAAGIYYYTSSNVQCSDSVSQIIASINSIPSVSLVVNDVSCNSGSDGEIMAQGINGLSPYAISWSNGISGTQNSDLQIGAYIITISDANGCVFDSIVNITEPNMLTYLEINLNPTCNSSCDGGLQLNVAGGITPYTYVWAGTNQIVNNVTGLCSGTYSAEIYDDNNCLLNTSAMVLESNDSLNAFFTVSDDSGVVPLLVNFINQSVGTDANTIYEWDIELLGFSVDENPTYTFYDQGVYQVEFVVTNNNGCSDTARTSIVVKSELIEIIPVVFSPNGDNLNDIFYLKIDNLTEINVQIYNRWGENVNSYDTANSGWDGTTTAGIEVPSGTYFYVATYATISEGDITLNGSISLLR